MENGPTREDGGYVYAALLLASAVSRNESLRGLDERWRVVSVPGAVATGSEYFPFSI
jgi:hypothetical protein